MEVLSVRKMTGVRVYVPCVCVCVCVCNTSRCVFLFVCFVCLCGGFLLLLLLFFVLLFFVSVSVCEHMQSLVGEWETLQAKLLLIGSQYGDLSTGANWPLAQVLMTIPATAFWIFCRLFCYVAVSSLREPMQKFSLGTVSHWSLTSRQPHMSTSRLSLVGAATSLIFVGTKAVCVCTLFSYILWAYNQQIKQQNVWSVHNYD